MRSGTVATARTRTTKSDTARAGGATTPVTRRTDTAVATAETILAKGDGTLVTDTKDVIRGNASVMITGATTSRADATVGKRITYLPNLGTPAKVTTTSTKAPTVGAIEMSVRSAKSARKICILTLSAN